MPECNASRAATRFLPSLYMALPGVSEMQSEFQEDGGC